MRSRWLAVSCCPSTYVSYPSGSPAMKWCAFAARDASTTSAFVAPCGLCGPSTCSSESSSRTAPAPCFSKAPPKPASSQLGCRQQRVTKPLRQPMHVVQLELSSHISTRRTGTRSPRYNAQSKTSTASHTSRVARRRHTNREGIGRTSLSVTTYKIQKILKILREAATAALPYKP
jgi:hypothetical protein